MPLYTFRCAKCGTTIEVSHSFSDPHPTKHTAETAIGAIAIFSGGHRYITADLVLHETCYGELVRVWDVPNIIYVGSGFYTTDKILYDHPTEMDIEDGTYDPYSP